MWIDWRRGKKREIGDVYKEKWMKRMEEEKIRNKSLKERTGSDIRESKIEPRGRQMVQERTGNTLNDRQTEGETENKRTRNKEMKNRKKKNLSS